MIDNKNLNPLAHTELDEQIRRAEQKAEHLNPLAHIELDSKNVLNSNQCNEFSNNIF